MPGGETGYLPPDDPATSGAPSTARTGEAAPGPGADAAPAYGASPAIGAKLGPRPRGWLHRLHRLHRPSRGAPVLVVLLLAVACAVVVLRVPASGDGAGAAPVPPPARSRVVTYLDRISGTATVAGQHNREPLSRPTQWTDKVRKITGTAPGLYGSDFAFSGSENRSRMVAAAIAQWRAGSLVTLMWHMCPPGLGQSCDWKRDVQSRLTDAQWTELTTEGSALNRAWTAQVDAVVPYLRQLQAAGVEVLWRPLHEPNDDWAWWGGRPGPSGSSKLFRMLHDHLTAQGLAGLVWVWSVSDVNVDRAADYYPGDRYVDVVGLDAWASPFPGMHSYEVLRALAGSRPLALTEVGTVPTPGQLAQQPRWTYFMVWAEMLLQRSSVSRIQYTYADRRVLTQGRIALPAATGGTGGTGTGGAGGAGTGGTGGAGTAAGVESGAAGRKRAAGEGR